MHHTASAWFTCAGLVEHDDRKGQVVKALTPDLSEISAEERTNLAILAMPEGASAGEYEIQTCFCASFRKLPTQWGFALYRVTKDPQAPRGYSQRSFFVLSRHPWEAVFGPLSRAFALDVFESNSTTALSSLLLASSTKWPAPIPGCIIELPTISRGRLQVKVPAPSPSCHRNRCPGCNPALCRALAEDILRTVRTQQSPLKTELSTHKNLSSVSAGTKPVQCQDAEIKKDWSMASGWSGLFDSRERSGFGGLWSALPWLATGPHPLLWSLWELVLVGEPLLLSVPSAGGCSAASMAVASIVSPLRPVGRCYPYLPVQSKEFQQLVDAQAHSGADHGRDDHAARCAVVGTSNPMALRSLPSWACTLFLPHLSQRHASVQATEAHPAEGVAPEPPPEESPCTEFVAPEMSLLEALKEGAFYSPSGTDVAPRSRLLLREGQELILEDCFDPQLAQQLNEILTTGAPAAPSTQPGWLNDWRTLYQKGCSPTPRQRVGADPCYKLDAVLAQHFFRLTQEFLWPFEVYFGLACDALGTAGSTRMCEDDPRDARRRKWTFLETDQFEREFDETSFLDGLRRRWSHERRWLDGSSTPLGRCLCSSARSNQAANESKALQLYQRFVRGPNFRPWFESRRYVARKQLLRVLWPLKAQVPPVAVVKGLLDRAEGRRQRQERQHQSTWGSGALNRGRSGDHAETVAAAGLDDIEESLLVYMQLAQRCIHRGTGTAIGARLEAQLAAVRSLLERSADGRVALGCLQWQQTAGTSVLAPP